MPRRNFGSNFLGGFSQTFNPTFQNVLDNLMQEKRQRKIMDEQNRREAEERLRQEEGRKAVMDLFRGGENVNIPQGMTPILPQGINQFAPYSQEQQIERIGKIFPEPNQYYNAVSKLLTPKEQKDSYSYLKYDQPDGIYGFSKNQQRMVKIQDDNPFYKMDIKPINTVTGYGRDNQKIIRKFYSEEDAKKLGLPEGINYQDIPTGFYKSPSSGGKDKPPDVFNLDKYKQFLQGFETDYSQINKAATGYNTKLAEGDADQSVKGLVNNQMNEKEITFYNGMIPSARRYINDNYYNQLKNLNIPAESEYVNRKGMKDNFIKSVTEDYKDGQLNSGGYKIDMSEFPKPEGMDAGEWKREIEAQTYKTILLWAKLKFDRL